MISDCVAWVGVRIDGIRWDTCNGSAINHRGLTSHCGSISDWMDWVGPVETIRESIGIEEEEEEEELGLMTDRRPLRWAFLIQVVPFSQHLCFFNHLRAFVEQYVLFYVV